MPNEKLKLIRQYQMPGMKAIMLTAGSGVRLKHGSTAPCPKVLLRFGGKTLLPRLDIVDSDELQVARPEPELRIVK